MKTKMDNINILYKNIEGFTLQNYYKYSDIFDWKTFLKFARGVKNRNIMK